MKLNLFALAAALTLAMNANADGSDLGVAEVVGIGEITASPELIQVIFSVNSECQLTPSDAQRSTDEAVTKIHDRLERYRGDDELFEILVDGGYTSGYSRWHDHKEICQNTFQKRTTISLKLGARENFDEIFSQIQEYVLKQFSLQRDTSDEIARTYVTIGVPNPELTEASKNRFERQAYDLAVRDSKERFKALLKSCEPHRWKINKISEMNDAARPQAQNYRLFASTDAGEQISGQTPAPVGFDAIKVAKKLSVSFHFDGALCFEP